jgi:acyl carrier protein
MEERVFSVVSKILETPLSAINVDSKPETIPNWDSLNHIKLMLALEEEFNIQFSDEEVLDLNGISKIIKTIRKHTS